MRKVKVAATQMACFNDVNRNIENAERLVRKAAENGANIILIQELLKHCISVSKSQASFILCKAC